MIRELPSIFDGSAKVKAQPQDDSKATLAPKVHLAVEMTSMILDNQYLTNYSAAADWGPICFLCSQVILSLSSFFVLHRLLLRSRGYPLMRKLQSYIIRYALIFSLNWTTES